MSILSLVTVNYNGADRTIRLLDSLRAQTDQNFNIIVVDNASSEHDFRRLERGIADHFSSAKLVRNVDNLGFSGGNNIGIRIALNPPADGDSNWVVLINNDTWVEADFIARLKPILGHSGGILGIPTREGDKTAYCGKIEWLTPTLQHVYGMANGKWQMANDLYAVGAGVAIHRSVFEKIGYLNERYFLYFEDADFSMRAHKAGIKISVAEYISIHHEVSGTTKHLGVPLLQRYHWRNAHLFNWKNGLLWIKILLPFWSFWTIIKQLVKITFMPGRRATSLAILAGIFDFYAGKFGKIKD